MTTKKTTAALACAVGIAALLATAGCAAGGTDQTSADTKTVTKTTTPSPSTGDTTSSAPTASSGTSGGSTSGGSGSGGGTSSGSGGSSTLRSGQCATPDLAASVTAAPGGGSAGHTELEIVLRNEGSTPCTLQGWPGVSFVGHGNGTQLGAAATLDRSSAHGTVTLAAGSVAHALLQVADAQNYGSQCQQVTADGFRVYPPGEKRALLAQNSQLHLTACTDADLQLLDVQAFQPGS